MISDHAFNWSTASLELAAAFASLGFPVRTNETEFEELKNQSIKLRYYIGPRSEWCQLERDALRRTDLEGTLLREDPYHPFLQAQRAAAAYMTLLQHVRRPQTGLRLVPVPGAPLAWSLEPGQGDPRLTLAEQSCRTNDLPLCAALAVAAGVPIIDILGTPGNHAYKLPARGLRALTAGDAVADWETARLMARQQPGQPALRLEQTHPNHPLVHAYQGAYTTARLNAHIQQKLKRMVLLKAPGSKRRAYISDTPTETVLEDVRRHFRIPR